MEIISELQQRAQLQPAEASIQTDRQMNQLVDGASGCQLWPSGCWTTMVKTEMEHGTGGKHTFTLRNCCFHVRNLPVQLSHAESFQSPVNKEEPGGEVSSFCLKEILSQSPDSCGVKLWESLPGSLTPTGETEEEIKATVSATTKAAEMIFLGVRTSSDLHGILRVSPSEVSSGLTLRGIVPMPRPPNSGVIVMSPNTLTSILLKGASTNSNKEHSAKQTQ
ncbi:hypothetical protein ACRRTK_019048 [Alexandromys fortis]